MNKLAPISLILGLASTFTVLVSSDQNFKDLGYIGFGASVSALLFGISQGNVESRQKHDESNQIVNMQQTVEKLNNERVKALNDKNILVKQFEEFRQQNDTKLEILRNENLRQEQSKNTLNEKIIELKNDLKTTKKDSDSALRGISNFSTSSAYEIALNTYDVQVRKLDGIIQGYRRNYPALAEFFDNLEAEIDQIKSRSIAELEQFEGVKTLQVLIDEGLRIQERIISRCYDIKLKALTTIIRFLEELAKDSVDFGMYQKTIEEMMEKAKEQILIKQSEGDYVVVQLEEFCKVTEKNYSTEFSSVMQEGKKYAERITELNQIIEAKNRPYKWSVATRQDLRIGNIIIGYFEAKGIILDRAKADFDHWESTLSFHVDRNDRIIVPNELEPENERLQQLTHTLSPIKFDWNAEEGLLTAWLHLAKQPKKAIAENDISKIWRTSDKFPSIVKGWSRVRLTGGSESGKSPTAENLAVCILLARGGCAELFNPQADSVKNYWSIPTVGLTHEDSLEGIEALASQVNQKTNDRSQFKLTIFDEIDSTMVSVEKKEQAVIGQNISTIIKQVSHQNLGCIFIGQNANVSQYAGMNRSDWNSSVNVHIGSNAYDAITNTNQIKKEEQDRLKGQADKLTEFCDMKNSELFLEKTNPQAYRFALVMGDGKPYFIQLPNFGEYNYNMVEEVLNCPKCGSHQIVKNGGNRRRCNDCKHNFTV